MGTWFEASKNGTCGSCGVPVHVGDRMLARRKGVYLCEACGTIAEQLPEGGGAMEVSVLASLDEFPDIVREGALAQAMLLMARQLDGGYVQPRDIAPLMKEIRQNYMQLRLLHPSEGEEDETDAMRGRRESRFRYDEGYEG